MKNVSCSKVPKFKHDTFGKRAFAAYGPLAWNCLPNEIKLCDVIQAFKRNLKTHLFVKFVGGWVGMGWVIIVNWIPGNKLQWNFNRNLYIFTQETAFENVVRKIAAILSRPQCVNSLRPGDIMWSTWVHVMALLRRDTKVLCHRACRNKVTWSMNQTVNIFILDNAMKMSPLHTVGHFFSGAIPNFRNHWFPVMPRGILDFVFGFGLKSIQTYSPLAHISFKRIVFPGNIYVYISISMKGIELDPIHGI